MTVYVDKLVHYRGKGYWCHMASDLDGKAGLDELHALATKIGLQRAWFQDRPDLPHYDLRDGKQVQAMGAGALLVDGQELLRRCHARYKRRTP